MIAAVIENSLASGTSPSYHPNTGAQTFASTRNGALRPPMSRPAGRIGAVESFGAARKCRAALSSSPAVAPSRRLCASLVRHAFCASGFGACASCGTHRTVVAELLPATRDSSPARLLGTRGHIGHQQRSHVHDASHGRGLGQHVHGLCRAQQNRPDRDVVARRSLEQVV